MNKYTPQQIKDWRILRGPEWVPYRTIHSIEICDRGRVWLGVYLWDDMTPWIGKKAKNSLLRTK